MGGTLMWQNVWDIERTNGWDIVRTNGWDTVRTNGWDIERTNGWDIGVAKWLGHCHYLVSTGSDVLEAMLIGSQPQVPQNT